MDKLIFGISGIPHGEKKMTYPQGIEYLKSFGLDAMELPFVRSVNVTDKNRSIINEKKSQNDFYLSAHGSYFINLNAVEPEKREASKERILKGAEALSSVGGRSLVFHAGYYLDKSKEETMHNIIQELHTLEDIGITYRLETTGKETQFGNLDELIEISKQVKTCGICVDFSHIHARYNGSLKTYDDFSKILDKIGTNLGDEALKDMHIHISGINYGAKGEKNHLPFEESDFNYKDCMKALKQYDVAGCIVCESPTLEIDAKLLKDYYYSL